MEGTKALRGKIPTYLSQTDQKQVQTGRDVGWKTLTEASNKPRKIPGKLQKKGQVADSDLFSVQVVVFG